MSRSLLFLISLFVLISCEKDVPFTNIGTEHYVFGHFYGFCRGEQCIEIFKVTSTEILEDQTDKYPDRDKLFTGNFKTMPNVNHTTIVDLIKNVPDSLWLEEEIVIGCPDCADQGGIYIEVKRDNEHKFWLIDNSEAAQPQYLKEYARSLRAAIEQLSR